MQGKNFESKWELTQISLPVLSTTTPLITKLYRGYKVKKYHFNVVRETLRIARESILR